MVYNHNNVNVPVLRWFIIHFDFQRFYKTFRFPNVLAVDNVFCLLKNFVRFETFGSQNFFGAENFWEAHFLGSLVNC